MVKNIPKEQLEIVSTIKAKVRSKLIISGFRSSIALKHNIVTHGDEETILKSIELAKEYLKIMDKKK